MKSVLQSSVLLIGVVLSVLASSYTAEPSEKLLAEKEIEKILAQNDKLLVDAQRAHKQRETAELEKSVGNYTQNANRLSQALEEDRFQAANPEELLWRVDKAALKQRTLLEKLLRQSAEDAHVALEEALAAARRTNRAALDAITRLHDQEFRLHRGRSGGLHQERREEVYFPGTPSPRPRPEPPP